MKGRGNVFCPSMYLLLYDFPAPQRLTTNISNHKSKDFLQAKKFAHFYVLIFK
jgi:hypothetical protein